MDSIASYISSDSESELCDNEKLGELQKKEELSVKLCKEEKTSQKQNFRTMKQQIVNHQSGNYTMLSNNFQSHYNPKELKRTQTEDDPMPMRNVVKPYIPKSKRTKLLQESECNQEKSKAHGSSTKLSSIFLKAQIFLKNVDLQYKLPKNTVTDFEGHQQVVNRIGWNPCFADFLLTGSMDSIVKVWNVETTPCCVYQVQSHKQAVKDAKWSHDGFCILSGGYDKMARITDINIGEEICQLKHNSFVTSVQYHPSDHNVFLSGTSSDGIFSWDIRSQKFISRYKSFFGEVQDLVFYPDGQSFISAAEVLKRNSTDKGIMVWDYKTSTILSNQVFQEAYTCTALQIHPTDNTFLAQCNAGYIAVFSQRSPYKLNKYKRFEGHQVSGHHIGLHISPDGTLIASGSSDGTLFVYNYRTSKLLRRFPSHSQPCMDVAWSPTVPSLLASCDWNGRIVLHR